MAKKRKEERDELEIMADEILAKAAKEEEEDSLDEDEESEENKEEAKFDEDEDDIKALLEVEEKDEQDALSVFLFEEESGFSPTFDWESIKDECNQKHEEIMQLEEAALPAYVKKHVPHWQKWIAACSCARFGQHDIFRELCNAIIKSKKRQPEICYEDIYMELIQDYVETKEFKEAFEVLEKYKKAFPAGSEELYGDDTYEWVKALLLIESGSVHEGREIFNKIAMKDPESGNIQFEIGASLLNMSHPELALIFLDKAKMLAKMNRNYELTTTIDDARYAAIKMAQENEAAETKA